MRLLATLFLLVVGIVGVNYYLTHRHAPVEYRTVKVERRDLTESVAVTGYAEPVEVRIIQSEILGMVEAVLVDFNDEVKEGQVLARLSSDFQRVQLEQAETQLDTARQAVRVQDGAIEAARAGVQEAQAAFDAANREYETAKQSVQRGLIPPSKVDTAYDLVRKAESARQGAQGQLERALAGKQQAESQVKAAAVAVQLAQLNLSKTELRSTIDGIVLNRDLQVGDAVGRPKFSLTDAGGTLFQIAANLKKMRAIVKVSEADYSRVEVGQKAKFTIDAYPNEPFIAQVTQVRIAPILDQTGVSVSYATVLEFENRRAPSNKPNEPGEWMVRPHATVSADIEVRQAKNTLVVPNAAILYLPSNFNEETPEVSEGEVLVWSVGPDHRPYHRKIKVGITDGSFTQVLGGDLKEGHEVITSEPVVARKGIQLPIGN